MDVFYLLDATWRCDGLLASLRFSSDWPLPVVVAFVLFVSGLSILVYSRESRELSSPYTWLLPGLRATAIALTLLLLAGPIWHKRQVIGQPTRVVFAVDQSLSMNETDSPTAPTRLDRAAELLIGSKSVSAENENGWIEDLQSTHLVDVVAFDASTRVVWSSHSNENAADENQETLDLQSEAKLRQPGGMFTDLMSPLRMFLPSGDGISDLESVGDVPSEEAASDLRVAVLLSDGRDTVGSGDAAAAAAKLSSTGWQVHTVAMGSLDEPDDLGIIEVQHPQRVAVDGRLAGQVKIKHYGQSGQKARVNILFQETVVWSDEVSLGNSGSSDVNFDFAVEPLMEQMTASTLRGVDRDTIALALSATTTIVSDGNDTPLVDTSPSNNAFDFRVAAASRDRRLLLVDGSSRWETRYLRNLFSRDPAWDVDVALFGQGTDSPRVSRGEKSGQLPAEIKQWSRYDAVILGEIPVDQWTQKDTENLQKYVSRGGALVVVDGRYNRIAKWIDSTGLVDSMQVSNSDSEASPSMSQLIPVRSVLGANRERVESILPTETGRQHPIMAIGGEPSDLSDAWQQLPAPSKVSRVEAAIDAEVWAEAVLPGDETTPWLVTRLFGAGRVFYLASDETWRWRYKVEGRLHGRFWNQLLSEAMQPPYAVKDEFVAIGTDRLDYQTGQSSTIRVRLLDPSRSLNGDGDIRTTVDAVLVENGQVIASVPMQLDDAARKTYVGKTPPLKQGAYQIQIRASGYDAAALKATAPIWVDPPRGRELTRVAVDATALRDIAKAGGGIAVHESDARSLLEQIRPLSRGQIIQTDVLLWQSWWIFSLIVGLLAIEWWLRKKAGLV